MRKRWNERQRSERWMIVGACLGMAATVYFVLDLGMVLRTLVLLAGAMGGALVAVMVESATRRRR